MQNKSKIHAFTLSEMVVVLILTSIVVGLAFSVLNLVQKHMAGIKNNFLHTTELNKLEQSLSIDFNRYSKIEYDAFNDTLKFATELDSISYQFHETYIVKVLDTFPIQAQRKTFYFNGNPMETGHIDAIKLETSKTFQNQLLFVFKVNDAKSFID